jgi:hypothetical protein
VGLFQDTRFKRRLVVRKDDILVIDGLEIEASILCTMLEPGKRLLWAFIHEGGDVRPAAYSEDQCIWLEPADLDRRKELPAEV